MWYEFWHFTHCNWEFMDCMLGTKPCGVLQELTEGFGVL